MNFTDIKGQEHVKRGLEVAMVGEHSTLLIGPPGSGRHSLVKRLPTITDTPVYFTELPRKPFKVTKPTITVGIMAPCPCGHFTDPKIECQCTPYQIQRHLAKLQGHSFDICLTVPRFDYDSLSSKRNGEPSSVIKRRIIRARRNPVPADMSKEGEELLKMAILELGIAASAYDKILSVAGTIAAMENKTHIEASHISEAISYRSLDRDFWI